MICPWLLLMFRITQLVYAVTITVRVRVVRVTLFRTELLLGLDFMVRVRVIMVR